MPRSSSAPCSCWWRAGLFWFACGADDPPPTWELSGGILFGLALVAGAAAVAAANVAAAAVLDPRGAAIGWTLAPALLLLFARARIRPRNRAQD